MIDLTSEEARRNPFPLYGRLRANAPVLRDPASGMWLLLDFENVKRSLQDHDLFSSAVCDPAAAVSRWLTFSDPPRHGRLRALVSKAFTPRVVDDLETGIRRLSRGLLVPVLANGRMDLMLDYAVPLPLCVIAEMLGVPTADWRRLREWSDVMMGLIHTLSPGPRGAAAIEAFHAVHQEMNNYVAALAAERRSRPQADLLTRLVQAEVDGERLSQDELVGFFQLLLLAGHETTTNLIGNAVLSLIEHPDQLARLRSERSLINGAIEEVLRYRSPVQVAFRMTRRDVEMAGQTIPAASLVLAVIGSANRDARQFANADRFDITRQPNAHIAFGHGIHSCIGAPLARLEARVALEDLLALPGLRKTDDQPWPPREAFHVHGPAQLMVDFEARS
jgi:cytochrome P450